MAWDGQGSALRGCVRHARWQPAVSRLTTRPMARGPGAGAGAASTADAVDAETDAADPTDSIDTEVWT